MNNIPFLVRNVREFLLIGILVNLNNLEICIVTIVTIKFIQT